MMRKGHFISTSRQTEPQASTRTDLRDGWLNSDVGTDDDDDGRAEGVRYNGSSVEQIQNA
jgi:hypothetical protein